VPVRILVATGVALLILTVITVVVARFDFGAANVAVALAIAGIKASLVVLFFMHLKYDRPFHSFVFVGSIAFVLLFIGFALTDSVEYRDEVIAGDGPEVIQRLDELEAG
jgi:cytochrome c oxidase subunit 4